jgi:hypothetical protein
MLPPLDLERFAQLSAEIDVGNRRDQVLAEAGVSLETWLAAQQWWLSRMGAEATRKRYDLTNRYQAAFLAYRKIAFVRLSKRRHLGAAEVAPPSRHAERPAQLKEVQAPLMGGYGANAAPAEGPRLTLSQYASLRAEMAVYPAHLDAIRGRYGFDEASYAREDGEWQWRFEADKALFAQYVALFRHYRDWLLGAASNPQ